MKSICRLILFFSLVTYNSIVFANTVAPVSPPTPTGQGASGEDQGTLVFDKGTPVELPKKETPAAPAPPTRYHEGESLWGFHGELRFPHVYSYGLDYTAASRSWGADISMGSYKNKTTDSPALEGKFDHYEVSGRYHPYQGVFYLGAHLGQQDLSIKATDTYLGQSVSITSKIKSSYFSPHIGFLWITKVGIIVATELGAQVNFGGSVDIDDGTVNTAITSNTTYQKDRKDTEDTLKKLSSSTIPFVTLIKIGYFF